MKSHMAVQESHTTPHQKEVKKEVKKGLRPVQREREIRKKMLGSENEVWKSMTADFKKLRDAVEKAKKGGGGLSLDPLPLIQPLRAGFVNMEVAMALADSRSDVEEKSEHLREANRRIADLETRKRALDEANSNTKAEYAEKLTSTTDKLTAKLAKVVSEKVVADLTVLVRNTRIERQEEAREQGELRSAFWAQLAEISTLMQVVNRRMADSSSMLAGIRHQLEWQANDGSQKARVIIQLQNQLGELLKCNTEYAEPIPTLRLGSSRFLCNCGPDAETTEAATL
jgi:hypothetical protein